MKDITIYHPYGAVGPLPWQDKNSDMHIEFGGRPSFDGLWKLSFNIRTFAEEKSDLEEINYIQQSIKNGRKIIVLGFGFNNLNCRLLFGDAIGRTKIDYDLHIFGTAYEYSTSDCEEIEKKLRYGLCKDLRNNFVKVHHYKWKM